MKQFKTFDDFYITTELKDEYINVTLSDCYKPTSTPNKQIHFHTSEMVWYNPLMRFPTIGTLSWALKLTINKLIKRRNKFHQNEQKRTEICKNVLAKMS